MQNFEKLQIAKTKQISTNLKNQPQQKFLGWKRGHILGKEGLW
jgi:hypothetical protein